MVAIIATADHASPAQRIVYVVDDEAGVRMALAAMLDEIGRAAWPMTGGADLLDALDTLPPGCILLDMRMPKLGGIEVMERLAERGCDWPVIVMTAHGDVPLAVRAMKLGAIEFIEKPFGPDLLAPALERGFAKLDDTARARRERSAALDRLNKLTPREDSVLHWLIEGGQNKAVAYRLGLSVRTVEMHRANLLAKLGLRTPQEAMALVARAHGTAASTTAARSAA